MFSIRSSANLAFHHGQTFLNLLDLQALIRTVATEYAARLGQRFFELSSLDLEVILERVEPFLVGRDIGLHLADTARRRGDK